MTTAELAEAVKTAVNAESFSVAFTATRVALPEFQLKDMATLHVTVVPREIEIGLQARGRNRHTMGVDVAVQQRLATVDNATVDALIALVEEVAGYMTRKNLTSGGETAYWSDTEINPLYDSGHLREMRQFTSVIRLTYWEDRAA